MSHSAMNVPKLYDLLRFIDELDREQGLQTKLEAIKSSLDELVTAPAQPQYQTALATAIASFTDRRREARRQQYLRPSER